ncbi:4-hydroxythreonine-4-phosphate dehydrogenase PdxA, partial [bacterium]|nr:4-hydroxythreonine-4-phosphate dehydrogenase PdxA [bacterium]
KILLEKRKNYQALLIGKTEIFEFYNKLLNTGLSFRKITGLSSIEFSESIIPVYDVFDRLSVDVVPGTPSVSGASAAMEAVKTAAKLALDKKISAVVTAPICKKGINQAGYHFKGHTDYLAHLTNTKNYVMMLVGGGLRVSLATIHIPLKDLWSNLTMESLYEVICITNRYIKLFGVKKPKIALCGVNPHAGEEGLLGNEEKQILKPAMQTARADKINVTGIYPSDTVYWEILKNNTADAVVAMYHDQGLIPVKTLAFDCSVNVTLGLPIIRTSPDHGTAFAIAGKNKANEKSMKTAVKTAVQLVCNMDKF